MSRDLQHFLAQHPSFFAEIFPLYFLTLWFLTSASISCMSGWSSLSKAYRREDPFTGPKWGWQSAQMRWRINYNNILSLGASPEGLYLSTMFLFRFMHPPLLIPWSEIRVRRTRGWIFEYVTLSLGRELAIPLRIRAGLATRLRDPAGNYWPVEET